MCEVYYILSQNGPEGVKLWWAPTDDYQCATFKVKPPEEMLVTLSFNCLPPVLKGKSPTKCFVHELEKRLFKPENRKIDSEFEPKEFFLVEMQFKYDDIKDLTWLMAKDYQTVLEKRPIYGSHYCYNDVEEVDEKKEDENLIKAENLD